MPFMHDLVNQENFQFPHCLQVCFDGKTRPDETTGGKKEFVSVAVSGPGMEKEKFLGERMVDKGTGFNVGEVAVFFLRAWNLVDSSIAINHDTCTVNIGRELGKKINL